MENLGKWGEETALSFLKQKGYKFLEKNWRTRQGEIDLVMRDGKTIVFVEVKTRSTLGFGFPEESLLGDKLEHLVSASEQYLEENKLIDNYRIDCIAIIGGPRGPLDIKHIKGLQI